MPTNPETVAGLTAHIQQIPTHLSPASPHTSQSTPSPTPYWTRSPALRPPARGSGAVLNRGVGDQTWMGWRFGDWAAICVFSSPLGWGAEYHIKTFSWALRGAVAQLTVRSPSRTVCTLAHYISVVVLGQNFQIALLATLPRACRLMSLFILSPHHLLRPSAFLSAMLCTPDLHG